MLVPRCEGCRGGSRCEDNTNWSQYRLTFGESYDSAHVRDDHLLALFAWLEREQMRCDAASDPVGVGWCAQWAQRINEEIARRDVDRPGWAAFGQ